MPARARLIVVGGHTRHVGKTTVVSALLRSLPAGEWTAVKISGHAHGRNGCRSAREAMLIQAPDERMDEAAGEIERILESGRNVIAESNRLVAFCRPDLVVFVISPERRDWKPSSGMCLRVADALVITGRGPLPEEAVELAGPAVHIIPRIQMRLDDPCPRALAEWLRAAPVAVTSVAA